LERLPVADSGSDSDSQYEDLELKLERPPRKKRCTDADRSQFLKKVGEASDRTYVRLAYEDLQHAATDEAKLQAATRLETAATRLRERLSPKYFVVAWVHKERVRVVAWVSEHEYADEFSDIEHWLLLNAETLSEKALVSSFVPEATLHRRISENFFGLLCGETNASCAEAAHVSFFKKQPDLSVDSLSDRVARGDTYPATLFA
jgi:hypothetical protein